VKLLFIQQKDNRYRNYIKAMLIKGMAFFALYPLYFQKQRKKSTVPVRLKRIGYRCIGFMIHILWNLSAFFI
jgi:hypothetical protein